ncbi:MAG: cytochrome c peroxidase [Pseudomonadota bacterium]
MNVYGPSTGQDAAEASAWRARSMHRFGWLQTALCVLGSVSLGLLASATLALDLGPRPGFPEHDMDRVRLGQLLFYDPVLSGNKNISCATCHHPRFGTSDGVSLALGEGGVGLGPDRRSDALNSPEQRIPRNAPGLWNLGASEFTVFFHDGRLEADPSQPFGIRTPLGSEMAQGFQSALAAQAMFPVLSPDEMAGHYSENDVSQAIRVGLLSQPGGAWDIIAQRVSEIPEYALAFEVLMPGEPVSFTAIANVIADFIAFEWRADASPFDVAMAGGAPLSADAQRGMDLFYGEAGCSACHSGWFQTDHDFHAIAVPQIGPGKAARFESHARDTGRLRVTGDPADAYTFRTPSLRNVTLTAPYGHSGAYAELEDMVRHHLNPVVASMSYDIGMAILPDLAGAEDLRIQSDAAEMHAISDANALNPVRLTDPEVEAILAFLQALEDPTERLGVPKTVPSGLPVDQ